MSTLTNFYNGELPPIFNPSDFNIIKYIPTLQTDLNISGNIQSTSIQSSAIQLLDTNGTPSDVVSHAELGDAINNLIGGADGAYDTLKEIQTFLQADDAQISNILTGLGTKANQSDLNTTNTNVSNLSTQLTNDETTINSHTSSINTINSTLLNKVDSSYLSSNYYDKTSSDSKYATITNLNTANTNIASNTSSINTINSTLPNKADKSQIVYVNKWNVNVGVNTFSSVLTSLGSLTNQVVEFSAGTHNDVSGNTINQINMVLVAPDSAFSSPACSLNFPIAISGSTMTRCRISNFSFLQNFTIDGTLGRHNFKGCVFNQNFTLLNTTTNWVIFQYCSFSAQINIPSTFGGYCIFYFCDFSGATLNFNNLSNQQILINSCNNLPSLTGNFLLNGFNTTTTQSSINTTSLNCSGSVSLPTGSLTISSVNGLQSALDAKESITDLTTNYYNKTASDGKYALITSLNTTNSNVSQNTNDIITANNNITTLNNQMTTANNNISTINSKLTTDESNISTLQSQMITANNNIASNTTNISTNTSDITNLKNKTSAISYDSSTNTTSLNSKLIVSYDVSNNGNINLGDGINNDVVNLNANINANNQTITPAQIGYLSTLSSNVQSQINTKATNSTVVHLTGSETISGVKTFSSAPILPNNSISNANINNTCINSGFCDATSSIQTQLDSKASTTYVNNQIGLIFNNPDVSMNSITELVNALNGDSNYATTISNALALKANDNAVVHLTGSESISGQKTFSTGITLNGSDLNSRLNTDETNISTNTSDITNLKSKTSALSYDSVNNATTINSKLIVSYDMSNNGSINLGDGIGSDVVNLKANISANNQTITPAQIGYLSNLSGDVQTSLNSKASDSSVVHLSGSETISGVKTFSSNPVFNNNAIPVTKINNTAISSGYVDFTSSGQTQINTINTTLSTKANDNSVVHLTGAETIAGIKTFSSAPVLPINSITNANINNTAINSGYVDFTSSGQTQLNTINTSLSSKANDNAVVHLSGAETIGGIKTFSSAPVLPNNSITNAMINNTCINSGYCDATSSIQTQLNTHTSQIAGKQNTLTFDTTPTSLSTNPVTSGGVYTALASKQNTLTIDSSVTQNSTNPVQSGGVYTALQSYQPISSMSNYLTNSTASATYQPISGMSSYLTSSSASSTYAPISNASFTGTSTFNEIVEQVYSAGSGGALSLTYTSIKGVIYYTPSGNFTLTLSSVPTGLTTATYTLTFIYNAKFYCNAITVNGTSYSMIAGGGLSNISINSSATYVMQTISITFLNSSTPVVITNVVSLF